MSKNDVWVTFLKNGATVGPFLPAFYYRAMFDSLVQASDSSKKIPQQISVSCTYCSKAVSSNFLSTGM